MHPPPHTQIEFNWIHVNRSQSFKTVFLGDSDVGKTCLAKLFVDRNVVDQTTNTIGFDHHVKEIELEGGIAVKVCQYIGVYNLVIILQCILVA